MVSIGVSFDGFEDTQTTLATARRAVAAGASSIWMAEHMGYREALVTSMGFRLNDPTIITIPTAVSPYLWHPSPTAMSLATIAEVGTGSVGVAVGVGNPLFLAESGKEVTRPVKTVREFIECLRRLWTGEAVRYDGEVFQLAGARLAFTPPNPLVVYVAATGPQMLAMAGAVADGVVLSAGLSALSCATSRSIALEGAKASGRSPDGVTTAAYLLVAVSNDGGRRARQLIRTKLAFLFRNRAMQENIAATGVPVDQEKIIDAVSRRDLDEASTYVSDDAIDAYGVAGTIAECRRRIEAYVASGLDEPILMAQGEPPDRDLALGLIREFAADRDSK